MGWPDDPRRAELKELSDIIGDEHDLAVFLETMHEEALFDPDSRADLDELIAGRRAELQRAGRPIGERLFSESPDQLVNRIETYWHATREYDESI